MAQESADDDCGVGHVASQTSWQTGYEGMIGVTEEEMAYGSTTCDPGGEED